jgi:putative aminopeptidase FrvX
VRDFILDVATAKEIAIQRQAVSRSTGTDTDAFAYATEGVASALISLPLKYMHTTVETVHKDDVQKVIDLIYNTLQALKGDEDWRYIK